jgi:photosystem II stability/assembly factor-like uncharacterized protein
MRRSFAVCLAALLACAAAPAQPVAPIPAALLQNLTWRSIGPFRGGRVLAVAGDPASPRRFYFGGVNGGVWRSEDAGRTWQPISDAIPNGSIGAIAIAPSAPATLYVGTGEADMRSDIAQGIGLFRSTDAGRSWQAAGLADTQQIGKILVDPADPQTLLVAALGHPYGPNRQRGVFRSTDGGRSWARTLFLNDDTGAIDLAAQPNNPSVVYAALWQTRRPPWNVYPPSNGPGSGLYKSTDGGRSWTHLAGHGLPSAPGRIGLATTAASPNRVYALISDAQAGAGQGGLYRSDDAGGTWVRATADKRITERGWYFSGITADPNNAAIVYVMDTIVLKSTDAGAHFIALKGDPTGDDFHTLWIDPRDSARQSLGTDQGALVTLNGGATWSSWYNQPTGQFYHVSTDNRFPYRVYGAQQDSGAAAVASRSDDTFDGLTMMDFHESAAGGESDNIAPDPDDPDTVYGGRVDRLDLRSNQLRSIDPTLAFPDDYRATWTLPLAWGPKDHALYFANQRIFRTTDGGNHWRPISPDLTRDQTPTPATLDAPTAADLPPNVTARRGVVYAIAPSPLNAALIWAGTDDGQVWRTTDAGAHWANVTPAGLRPWSKIGIIEASHFDAATAYLAIDRHRLDDPSPHLLRTTDAGKTWTAITAGLPDSGSPNSVNVVREDPKTPGLLFAGTESSAYVSFTNGAQWQPLARGLPPTSIRDIVVHGDDLVLATHGRGFYILDDIASLRALAKDPSQTARLFPPADAIRFHPPAFTGTPMPKDEPLAANPADGLMIDYVIPPTGAHTVTIAITDPAGALVRRYSSKDTDPTPDPATLPVAPEWAPANPSPATGPGAHRFVWNLHYTPAAELQSGDRPSDGVWAPPGPYTVTLTIDGQSFRQTARILPDPRLHLHAGDLQAQFALARRVEAAQIACEHALSAATALLPKLTDRSAHARLAALIDAPHPGNTANPNALSDLEDRLAALAQAADGADGAPTPDAQAAYTQAAAALAADLKTLHALAR